MLQDSNAQASWQARAVNTDRARMGVGYLAGPAAASGALVGAIILFNFFPQQVGILVSADDPSSFVPLLAPEFRVHLPWLNLWWGLALAMNLVDLTVTGALRHELGTWQVTKRWIDVGLSFFCALILFRLLIGGPIVQGEQSVAFLTAFVKFVLALALMLVTLAASSKLCHLLGYRPTETRLKRA